jgi:hypothetical protein
MQLDLFRTTDEESVRLEFNKLRVSCDATRKSLFARNNLLEKQMIDLEKKLEDQKKELDRMKEILFPNKNIISIQGIL